jgi:uncharacterized membrane protein
VISAAVDTDKPHQSNDTNDPSTQRAQTATLSGRISRTPRPTLVVLGLSLIHAMVVLWLAIQKQRNFATYGFDFGLYDQAWWLLGQSGGGFDTVRGLPIWGHHTNFILILLAPFARLGFGNWFLILVQTTTLALGALPVSWMARERLGSARAGVAFGVAYLIYPPTTWLSFAPFHPECLSVTPMLFGLWFASQRNWKRFVISMLFALATREEVGMCVAVLGLCMMFNRDQRKAGGLTFIGGAGWFLLCFKVLIPHALGGQAPFYVNHFFAAYGNSMGEVVKNLTIHPSNVVRASTTPEAMRYLVDLFGPLGFLPVFAWPFLMTIPQLAIVLLGSEKYLRTIVGQYTALMIPGLMTATINVMSRLKRSARQTGPNWKIRIVSSWLVICMSFGALVRTPLPGGIQFSSWSRTPPSNFLALTDGLKLIPSDAATAASPEFVPHLAHRSVIYNFPTPFAPVDYGNDGATAYFPAAPTWIIVNKVHLSQDAKEQFAILSQDTKWEKVFDRDSVIVLRARP